MWPTTVISDLDKLLEDSVLDHPSLVKPRSHLLQIYCWPAGTQNTWVSASGVGPFTLKSGIIFKTLTWHFLSAVWPVWCLRRPLAERHRPPSTWHSTPRQVDRQVNPLLTGWLLGPHDNCYLLIDDSGIAERSQRWGDLPPEVGEHHDGVLKGNRNRSNDPQADLGWVPYTQQ